MRVKRFSQVLKEVFTPKNTRLTPFMFITTKLVINNNSENSCFHIGGYVGKCHGGMYKA